MPIDATILLEIEHLRDLDANERSALAERMELLVYRAGEIIFNYGDPGHALYIMRSGEVEIYIKTDQGEKIVLEVAKPGEVFGEVSLLDDGPRTAWVAALNHAQILRLDREHFEDYVRLYTPAALHLLGAAARRLRRSDEFIRRTVARNANEVSQQQSTLPEIIVDTLCAWYGNLPSAGVHILIFAAYVVVNVGLFRWLRPWDPYPFGLLSVALNVECLLVALFVLASQNRQRERDSVRSDIEFETSMNTELKIAYLHEKIDRLTEGHHQMLANTQKLLSLQEGKGTITRTK